MGWWPRKKKINFTTTNRCETRKKLNSTNKGRATQTTREETKGYGGGPLKCGIYGNNRLNMDFPQCKSVGSRLYSFQEAETV